MNNTCLNMARPTAAPERQSLAIQVVRFAEQIEDQAQRLAGRVHEKLYSVMTCETPSQEPRPDLNLTGYPPLFADLYKNLASIHHAIELIEQAVDRTEL